jgi:hypothetical protein
MRNPMTVTFFTALLAGLAALGTPRAAFAAEYDGDWTVQVVTERGACDPTYSYNVSVTRGTIVYTALTSVSLSGTVSPQGAVLVNITHFDEGARGTGHLKERTGAGSWRGAGKSGDCFGRWEARRR